MLPLLAALALPSWSLSAADLDSLKSGHYQMRDFEADHERGATVRFFVKASLHDCYRILADSKTMPRYMPGLAAITVLATHDDSTVLKYHSSLFLVPDFVLERHCEPDRRITWKRIEAPYKRIDGAWDFLSVPGGTVLRYSVAIDTGQVLIPTWAAVALQKQGLPQLVHDVTKRIESNGTWIRPDYSGPR